MIKPRIKGKWFGNDKYRCVMWKCDEDKTLAIESLLPALQLEDQSEYCIVVESHHDEYEPLKEKLDEKERIIKTTCQCCGNPYDAYGVCTGIDCIPF